MLFDIFLSIVILILGYVWGWNARGAAARRRLDQLLEDSETQAIVDNAIIPIKIEKHGGIFYAYNLSDDSFMAQGDTSQQLETALGKRYPGKMFGADTAKMKEIGFRYETPQ